MRSRYSSPEPEEENKPGGASMGWNMAGMVKAAVGSKLEPTGKTFGKKRKSMMAAAHQAASKADATRTRARATVGDEDEQPRGILATAVRKAKRSY